MQTTASKTAIHLAVLALGIWGAMVAQAGDLYYLGGAQSTPQIQKPGFKATLGYQLSPSFALEGGYANSKSTGMNIAGLGLVPMSDQFSLFGKVGYATEALRTNWSLGGLPSIGSPERSNVGMGFGGIYQLDPKIGLRAEFEQLDSEVRQITFGLQARF
jgi:OOP family OmpA-OmpF porin